MSSITGLSGIPVLQEASYTKTALDRLLELKADERDLVAVQQQVTTQQASIIGLQTLQQLGGYSKSEADTKIQLAVAPCALKADVQAALDLKADSLALSDGLAGKADLATTYTKDVVNGLLAELPTAAALATKVNSTDRGLQGGGCQPDHHGTVHGSCCGRRAFGPRVAWARYHPSAQWEIGANAGR